MSDLVLYTNPMSRGRIARWMLEETGAAYTTKVITFGAQMKGDAYRAINPMGKVPALQHNGHIVTEVAAICAYLAETFPETNLAPKPDERASYYRWLFFGAGPVEAALSNHAMGFNPSAEQSRFVGYGCYQDVINTLEQALSATPYLTGARFTAADLYIGAQINFGLQFKTIEPRPVFLAYSEKIKQRPALLRANALDDAELEKLQK